MDARAGHSLENTREYVYDQLSSADHTRLIELHASTDPSAPLHICFLQIHVEEGLASYEAISYTWGGQALQHPLLVLAPDSAQIDAHVLITENLEQALRKLRQPNANRFLWADAICINQTNEAEKAKQIPIMARIFRGATRVLAWVNGGPNEERGLQQLGKLSRYWRYDVDRKAKGLPGPDLPIWERRYVRDFLDLPWFTRLWIIQEIVFSTDVILLCGTSELSWLRLMTALDVLKKTSAESLSFISSDTVEALCNIGTLWRHHCMIDNTQLLDTEYSLGLDILATVNKFWHYGCTDPRDRIYALYNLSDGMQPKIMKKVDEPSYFGLPAIQRPENVYMDIDYTMTIEQTYQTFASACMEGGYAIAVLNSSLERQFTAKDDNWPSWIPDWRVPPRVKPYPLNNIEFCRNVSQEKIALQLGILPIGPHTRGFPTVNNLWTYEDSIGSFTSMLHNLCKVIPEYALLWLLNTLLPNSPNFSDHLHDVIKALRERPNLPINDLSRRPQREAIVADSWDEDGQAERSQIWLDIVRQLRGALHSQCFFSAGHQWSNLNYIGYGNQLLRVGDHLGSFPGPKASFGDYELDTTVLILRPSEGYIGPFSSDFQCRVCEARRLACNARDGACALCISLQLGCHKLPQYSNKDYRLVGDAVIMPYFVGAVGLPSTEVQSAVVLLK